MYVIKGVRHEQDMHPDDRCRAPRAAADAHDLAMSIPLREAAGKRRDAVKRWRLAQLAGRKDIMAEETAKVRSIRRAMERRINNL